MRSESGVGAAARDQHAISRLKDLVAKATGMAGGGQGAGDTQAERRVLDALHELSTPAALLEVCVCVCVRACVRGLCVCKLGASDDEKGKRKGMRSLAG